MLCKFGHVTLGNPRQRNLRILCLWGHYAFDKHASFVENIGQIDKDVMQTHTMW